jgi:hypothetical protein
MVNISPKTKHTLFFPSMKSEQLPAAAELDDGIGNNLAKAKPIRA